MVLFFTFIGTQNFLNTQSYSSVHDILKKMTVFVIKIQKSKYIYAFGRLCATSGTFILRYRRKNCLFFSAFVENICNIIIKNSKEDACACITLNPIKHANLSFKLFQEEEVATP